MTTRLPSPSWTLAAGRRATRGALRPTGALLALGLGLSACGGLVNSGKADDSGAISDDLDGDGAGADDCNDDDPEVYPGAPEVCDGKDNDCDAQVDGDDDELVDGQTWYPDEDGDGYGDEAAAVVACEAPAGAIAEGGDCDDAAPAISPGTEEDCGTPTDDDCSGSPNDDGAIGCTPWYADADGDGHADPASDSVCICFAEGDYSTILADDCDDADPAAYTGAPELCDDGVDQDCDGDWDECRFSRSGPLTERGVAVSLAGPGLWVSGGEDADGDGRDDFAVMSNGGQQAALFTRAPTAAADTGDAALRLTPEGSAPFTAMAVTPDLDGDGDAQLVVAGPAGSGTPELAVFSGGLTGDRGPANAALRLAAPSGASVFAAVVGADLTGDGVAELIAVDTGTGTWFAADASASGTEPLTAVSTSAGSAGADRVAAAGDVDGDGFDDLLFGSPAGASGQAWLVRGGGAIPAVADADAAFTGDEAGDLAGAVVDGAGDLDLDGYDDLLISAPYHRGTEYRSGTVYLLMGAASGRASGALGAVADLEVEGELRNDFAGTGAAGAGDVDGDGAPDLIVGSPGWDTASYDNAGTAYFVYGPFTGTFDLDDVKGRVDGGHSNGQAGSVVASAGDLNADGFQDVLVGDPGNDTAGADFGVAWIFYGSGL